MPVLFPVKSWNYFRS